MDQSEGPIGDRILTYLAEMPHEGDGTHPVPEALHVRSVGEQWHLIPPYPELMLASLELLNADLVVGVTFERGVLHLKDSLGVELAYQPLWLEPHRRTVVLRRVQPRDDEKTPTEGDQHV